MICRKKKNEEKKKDGGPMGAESSNCSSSSLLSTLRCVWVFLERTQILSGIQFTAYFIEIFVVETK